MMLQVDSLRVSLVLCRLIILLVISVAQSISHAYEWGHDMDCLSKDLQYNNSLAKLDKWLNWRSIYSNAACHDMASVDSTYSTIDV